MKFLFDNNLPAHLARAICELSKRESDRVREVIALCDRFSRNAPDSEWLAALAQEGGWYIVSGDQFRKSDAEKELIRRSGLTVFVLHKSWSSHAYWAKAAQMVAWWPRILDQASLAQKAAFRVPWRTQGKLEQIRV